MDSLEKLQKRLSSLGELRSIVKTMKALSAASIRQYEQAVNALTSYTQTVERGLHVVVKDTPPFKDNSAKTGLVAAIVFGSDHGLCGRFNETISEFALQELSTYGDIKQHRIMTVGARITSTFEHLKVAIDQPTLLPSSTTAITKTVEQILLKIDEWQQLNKVEKVIIFFNQHTTAQGYEPTQHALLPLNLERFRSLPNNEQWLSNSLPVFTMPRDQLLSNLIHQYLFVSLFRACAESQASEHASRLSAMKSAQRNLDDRLSEVTKDYRHARQTVITSELLDIVSGFETIVGPKQ